MGGWGEFVWEREGDVEEGGDRYFGMMVLEGVMGVERERGVVVKMIVVVEEIVDWKGDG